MGLVAILCLLFGAILLFMSVSLVIGALSVLCDPPAGWLLFAMLLGVLGISCVNFALTGRWWFMQSITLPSWNQSLANLSEMWS